MLLYISRLLLLSFLFFFNIKLEIEGFNLELLLRKTGTFKSHQDCDRQIYQKKDCDRQPNDNHTFSYQLINLCI